MRKIGLSIIKLISLIRYYKLLRGVKIYLDSIIVINGNTIIKNKLFRNKLYLREKQSDPYIFEQVFSEQQYNFHHPRPNEVEWIIDAGANIGLAAIYFTTKYPNAKIISIEPNENNFQQLKKNTINYDNIICIQGALWHKEEMLRIANSEELSAGFIMEPKSNLETDNNLIPSKTINQLMEDFGIKKISILKLDIEGSEREIFEFNYYPWIEKTECIISELHDWIKPGTSQVFFKTMSNFDWVTYIKGENIICIKKQLF